LYVALFTDRLVHKSGAWTNDLPEESKNPEGNGRPSHSFRPSLRQAGPSRCRLRATYSNVLAGRVCTEKLEAGGDSTASRGVEIRSPTGLGNRQIRCLPPVSHSQAHGGRNRSHMMIHYVECARVSLPSRGIGAFNGLDTADSSPAFSLPVSQTPTKLSACGPRRNQPAADVHIQRRDLFSYSKLRRNQNLTKSKLKKEFYHEEPK
jgi:hypothetical protein